MNCKERLLAAIQHQPVDRVPANITYYMAAFSRLYFPAEPEQNPFEARLATYTRFGFDPLIGLGGGVGRPWQQNDPGRWASRQERGSNGDDDLITYIVETPAGELSTTYNAPAGMSGWQMVPLIKEERDLEALAYLPAPAI
ncbi:MAG: hypothetical protein JXA74_07775, partial [Anaerolineae bacterium]|nr:hypothetical protein [Anaerolineae bacterium]